MKILKIYSLFKLLNWYFSYALKFLTISYIFYLLSLLAICLVGQTITIIILVIYYNLNLIDVLYTVSNPMYNICIVFLLGVFLDIILTNSSACVQKCYFYYNLNKWSEILFLIVSEVFHYTFKLIYGSIRFRLIICTIMLSSALIGIDKSLVYYIIMLYMMIALVISTYKSNKKFKHLSKFVVNLAIIYNFWYNIQDLINIDIFILLVHNSMILTFDEWDFDFEIDLSEAINNLGLHGYSIGDPSIIPPIPPKFKHLVHDEDTDGTYDPNGKKYPDPRLFSSWKMHMAWEHDYRNFILVNGSLYYTDNMQDALESKPDIKETDMLEQKKSINDREATSSHMWTPRYEGQSVEEHKLELEFRMYQFGFEYNTLVKAKTYYDQNGLDLQGNPLHPSFKEAAEGWQKRQISMWSETYAVIHNLQAQNPFQVSNTLCAKNYFDDIVAYKEVRENLYWMKLFLIQADYVLKYFQAENKNNYTDSEYDAKIDSLNRDCYNKHIIAYTVFKHYKEWCINNTANPLIDQAFKDKVHQAFLEQSKLG